MMLYKRNKLVFGIGINDADYNAYKIEIVDGKQKCIWKCPFYERWRNMLSRCYTDRCKMEFPTYIGCEVVEEWKYFSNFKAWMEKQDWEGKQLDKDILIPGNKIYGPDNCVFVDNKTNSFIRDNNPTRPDMPIGVFWMEERGKFRANCSDVETGKRKFLGYFDDPQSAHKAWLAFKLKQAYILASKQTDDRVAKALIDRYENYDIEQFANSEK